jgi:pheromone shutdown-related protein TraB
VEQEFDPTHPDVTQLEVEGRVFYLVGTAHVSQASVELVESTIKQIKPDVVAVELCPSRYQALRDPERWKNTDIVAVVRQGKGNLLLAQLLLSSFQKRIGQQLGVKPGTEMLKALDLCEQLEIRTVLADRDVSITLKRTWSQLRWISLLRLLFSAFSGLGGEQAITAEEVVRLKRSDALEEALRELGQVLPEVQRTLVDERDQYLAAQIWSAPGQRVLAVVGAGHVLGIAKYLGHVRAVADLESLPAPSRLSRWLNWLLPLTLIALVAWLFISAGSQVGGRALGLWALATASAGALGTLLALAHPLTIVTGFLFAPLGALHPLVATGWATALMEATVRKPRVLDFEALSEQSLGLRLLYTNRVTRVLWVGLMTNLAVGLGNLAGSMWVVKAAL